MAINHIQDHVGRSRAQLLQYFQDKNTVAALTAVFAKRAQVLEDMLWGILTQRFFNGNPVGQQLDNLGKLLNLPRNGATDATYTRFLKAQVLVNLSSGTVTQLDNIFSLIADAGSTIGVYEYYPLGLEMRIGGIAQSLPVTMASVLQQAKAAGVLANLIYNTDNDAQMFCCEPLVAYLTAGILASATSGFVSLRDAALIFPDEFTFDKGTSVEETVDISSVNKVTGAITFASSLAFAHGIGCAISDDGSNGAGFDFEYTTTNGASSIGATSLTVVSAAAFPGSVTLIIDQGTSTEETVSAFSHTSTVFSLSSALTKAHASGALVTTTQPTGGRLAGSI